VSYQYSDQVEVEGDQFAENYYLASIDYSIESWGHHALPVIHIDAAWIINDSGDDEEVSEFVIEDDDLRQAIAEEHADMIHEAWADAKGDEMRDERL